jgi:hypothetical protein
MVRVKGKVKKVLRKKPVKAGSTDNTHGGLPTRALIKIMKANKNG